MIKRDELESSIEQILGKDLLEKARLKDELPNGVQFHGKEEVKRVALGVSLNEDFLKEAASAKADFLIFHHALDPRTHKSLYNISSQKRLRLIFENNFTIAGYHYALDAHKKLGNNATIARLLGANIVDTLYDEWGFVAELSNKQSVEMLSKKLTSIVDHDILAIYTGPEKVKTIGIVSGAGKPYEEHLFEMQQKGVELYISGEGSEQNPHRMKEMGINYFLCGHYATEVFGVQELGKALKAKYKDKLSVEFIDIPNPL